MKLWLMLACFPLVASDLTGIWVGRIPARGDDLQDIAFQLKQTGSKLAGKLYGDYQSSLIVDGTVAGVVVTFVVGGSEQAGNEIHETRTRYTGRFYDNGDLELTRERESAHTAGNGGIAGQKVAPPRVTFRLKRLT